VEGQKGAAIAKCSGLTAGDSGEMHSILEVKGCLRQQFLAISHWGGATDRVDAIGDFRVQLPREV
jgi:hypothetical protein